LVQHRRKLLRVGSGNALETERLHGHLFANEFVEADGNRLAEIHGRRIGNCRNADQGVAETHILIRETEFFGAEHERRAAGMNADAHHARFGALERLLGDAALAGGRADYERAVRHRFGHSGENARGLQNVRASDGGDSFAERHIVRIDEAEIIEAEIGDCTRGRPYIQGVTSGDENDCKLRSDTKWLHGAERNWP